MTELINEKILLKNNTLLKMSEAPEAERTIVPGTGTIAQRILEKHNKGTGGQYEITFDAMASHDITYVGIIQTARSGNLERFPMPYVLTNCHNSLCAVGGTINEDDHLFGLSAAQKYGGIFVPPHLAVIHQYMREQYAGCGKMILASDSHTRYGALGTLAVGEGGPELVKQLLKQTWNISKPQIVLVYLKGKPGNGVGPQDVALELIRKVFASGFVKNCILEFQGEGIDSLSVDYRNGIDVMTTETACLSSIWRTDEKVRQWLKLHGREADYAPLLPEETACYDKGIVLDLSAVKPMIALPYHPSNAFTIEEFYANAEDILAAVEKNTETSMGAGLNFNLREKFIDGKLHVDQGIIAGCSGGTFENISIAAKMAAKSTGMDAGAFSLSVYPASQPVFMELTKNGSIYELMKAGAVVKTAFCGPCFGAGDVPANNCLSIRHTTRNFPNREGSKPAQGQVSAVALMDARSIMATALNGGILTGADTMELPQADPYTFDGSAYEKRVYNGYGQEIAGKSLRMGPNISDWPAIPVLNDNIILELASVIHDEVTTTDELIPSGETSSLRSNPEKLAEFTLSRRDPSYVGRAKAVREQARALQKGDKTAIFTRAQAFVPELTIENTQIASAVYAQRPGDGSAREQAASCQRVLGGGANIAVEYATKRYRANLVNWGMLPLLCQKETAQGFEYGDLLILTGIRESLIAGQTELTALHVHAAEEAREIHLTLPLAQDEREIILAGCLINYYSKKG